MQDISFPDWVAETLEHISSPDYYGKITLHVKAGEIVIVRAEQTFVKNTDEESTSTFGVSNE